MRNRETGYTVVELLIILAGLAVIGLIGYAVWALALKDDPPTRDKDVSPTHAIEATERLGYGWEVVRAEGGWPATAQDGCDTARDIVFHLTAKTERGKLIELTACCPTTACRIRPRESL